jgi:folate-dependent phosphoribosylglycinamide formyltransferase PurN
MADEMSSTKRLRVILLTHGGAEKVLERLVALEGASVVGVFVETDIVRRYSLREKIRRSLRYNGYAGTIARLARKLFRAGGAGVEGMGDAEDRRELLCAAAARHGVPVHFVANYHAEESIALMREAGADLGVIYGTNIIKETVFQIPRLGSINLHQGLAPLYRGGPPVFWELFNGEKEVGLTVHFVAAKVDAGEILLQETVPLEYDYAAHGLRFESFIEAYTAGLAERSARLVAAAVQLIAEGTARPRPQDITQGRRYRLPTKKEKDELRRRLRERERRRGEAGRPLASVGAGAEER